MSKTTPKVSIVVPAYNRRDYIERTVESVLRQSYTHYELIVVDDGSTDGTFEVLSSYAAEGKLELLHHPGRANRGQSASLNLGLSVATGEYVGLLDSDDMYGPDKLEIMVAFLEAHPEVGLVYSNGYAVDDQDRILYEIYDGEHQEWNQPDAVLLDCYILLPQNAIVRRAVLETAGPFEESFRSAQDHDMIVRLAEITRFEYIPTHTFYYRRHADSISSKRQDLRWRTGFEVLRRARKRYPYRKSTIRRRLAVLHFRMAQVAGREGKWIKAAGRIALAGALDPFRGIRVLLGRERVR